MPARKGEMMRLRFSLLHKLMIALVLVLLPILATIMAESEWAEEELERQLFSAMHGLAEEREAFVLMFLEMSRNRVLDFSSDGHIVESLEAAQDVQEAGRRLSRYMTEYKLPLLRSIYRLAIITAPDGRVLASTLPGLEGRNMSREDFFRKGRSGVALTELVSGPDGRPELAMSAPIYSRRGGKELLGVIAGFTDMAMLGEIFSGDYIKAIGALTASRPPAWKTLDMYLVNREGFVLSRTRSAAEPLTQKVDTLPVRECLEKRAEVTDVYAGYGGNEVVGASMCLPSFGWTLVVEVDRAEVLAPIAGSHAFAMALAAVVVLSTGGLAYYYFRVTAAQIRRLLDGASALAAGDYGVVVPVRTSDEIGALAVAFNAMAASIRDRAAGLEKSEAMLKNAQRIARLGSWEWDIPEDSIRRSEGLLNMLGMAPGQFKGSYAAFLELIAPEDRVRLESILREALYERRPFSAEHAMVRSDGSRIIVRAEGEVSYDEAGRPLKMAGVAQDITERRLAEKALRESEQRLSAILDNMGNIVYLKDSEGRHLFVNRYFERLFGRQRDEVYGKTVFDLFPSESAASMHENDMAALRSGRPMEFEESGMLEDGYHAWLSIKFPLKDTSGRTYAVCGVSTDITALKRAEEEVRNLNVGLERRVEDRTRELTRAVDDLAAANRDIETFTYSVAHDLRSPLRLIDGFSMLLVRKHRERLGSEGQDQLDRIRGAVKRMGRLIDDLLNLSYVMRAELSCETISLSSLARTILSDLMKSEPDRAAVARIEDGLEARGDPMLLRMVLENLLGNAWKFTSREPKPVIEFFQANEEGGRAVFCVRDNGAGFDMRHRERLFRPFQRLHGQDEFPGTGIGLATVERIIHRHGGRVWAESYPGEGAVFCFSLDKEA